MNIIVILIQTIIVKVIVVLLTFVGHHLLPVQGQDLSQNLLSVTREGGGLAPSHLCLVDQEIIDLDHLSDLAITPAMIMIDGHTETLGMVVTEVEDGIWADCMIVILLSRGEIGVGVQVHELENHFEMIHIRQNVAGKVQYIRLRNHLVLVLDLQGITGEVDRLQEVMMKIKQKTEGVPGQNLWKLSIAQVIK